MEDLGDILKRLATRSSSGDRPPDALFEEPEPCERCGGRGWVTIEVPVGHPEFGQIVSCTCQEQELEQDRHDRLLRYSNLAHMARFTFESLDSEGLAGDPESQQRFRAALNAAREFCERPLGWLVLTGPHGSGKTHLAAAIGAASRAVEDVGGGTVVELTCGGLAPDPIGLREISRASGINVVMGCGHYVEEFQDAANIEKSVENFASEMISQVFGSFGVSQSGETRLVWVLTKPTL